jgi:NinB protein
MKKSFQLVHSEARRRALEAVQNAPDGYVVTVAEPTRNLDQNSALWPLLQAFAEQLVWPVNGEMERLTAEEWKDILSSAYRKEYCRVAPGICGGMVFLGLGTSKMSKREFSEFLEFVHATAVDRGVNLDYAS